MQNVDVVHRIDLIQHGPANGIDLRIVKVYVLQRQARQPRDQSGLNGLDVPPGLVRGVIVQPIVIN